MGTVYLAQDALLGRPVALKLLRESTDEAHLERFRREVLAGQDTHPNLVQTLEAGLWDGRLFMVMEMVPGGSLRDRIAKRGPLPAADAERLVVDLLEGLAHLHERGIVHRDVKAGNVLLGADGTAKLADFGLARVPGDETVTVTRAALGTPAYMAPEVIEGGKAGPPADLYALGVVLYEAVTGRRPFSGDSHAELSRQHVRRAPDPKPLGRASRRLRALTLRLLAKDPRRRFPDAGTCLLAWRSRRLWQLPRPRWRWVLAAGLTAGVGALLWLGPALGGVALSCQPADHAVRGVNLLGLTAWEVPVGRAFEVLAAPATRTLQAGYLVRAESDPGREASSEVLLLDRRGRELRRFVPAGEGTHWLRSAGVPGTLVVTQLLEPADVDGDGWTELLAVAYGAPWYLSMVGELFPDGSSRAFAPILFNPGVVESARFADADADGHKEWYVAALNNELLHTGAVYRVDGSIHAWPPPRMGTAPDFRTLAWFTPMPRRGDLSFVRLDPLRGGEVDVVMDDGERIRLDRWGNYPGEVAPGDDPTRASAMRLERYRVLSGAFLALRDQEVEVARRRLAEAAGQTTGDPLAEGFRLLLEGRLALAEGDCESADRLAQQSFDAAPVSNDAVLMAATARIVCGKAAEVEELLEPRIGMTMGSRADFQEVRGHLAWLRGEDQRAWHLWDRRGDLPPGLGAQHRARLLLGQDRAEAALAELAPAADMLSRERLELLTAMAELRLGRMGQAERALAAELDRHPWLRDDADLLAAVLECRQGGGSRTRLVQALAPVRQRARWDLYTHLDLPLQLALAADAATDLGERDLAAALLAEAEATRPGLELVAHLRAGLGRR